MLRKLGNTFSAIQSYITVHDSKQSSVAGTIDVLNTHLQAIKEPDSTRLAVGRKNEVDELLMHLHAMTEWLSNAKTNSAVIDDESQRAIEDVWHTTDRRFVQSILTTLTLATLFLTAHSTLDTVANPDRYTAESAWSILQKGLQMTCLFASCLTSLETIALFAKASKINKSHETKLQTLCLLSHLMFGVKLNFLDGFSASTSWSLLATLGKGLAAVGVIESSVHAYKLKRFFVQKFEIADIMLRYGKFSAAKADRQTEPQTESLATVESMDPAPKTVIQPVVPKKAIQPVKVAKPMVIASQTKARSSQPITPEIQTQPSQSKIHLKRWNSEPNLFAKKWVAKQKHTQDQKNPRRSSRGFK